MQFAALLCVTQHIQGHFGRMDAPAFSITHVIENGAYCKSHLQ
jgi:hypothetical protein